MYEMALVECIYKVDERTRGFEINWAPLRELTCEELEILKIKSTGTVTGFISKKLNIVLLKTQYEGEKVILAGIDGEVCMPSTLTMLCRNEYQDLLCGLFTFIEDNQQEIRARAFLEILKNKLI